MEKLRLIVIDKQMTTCEIEIGSNQFKSLGIDVRKAKKHTRKRNLNITITEFIESFSEDKEK